MNPAVRMVNILLLPIGRRAYMADYFLDAVGSRGSVHAGNSGSERPVQQGLAFFITPPMHSDEYAPAVLDYCIHNGITAVLPFSEFNTLTLSKAAQGFTDSGITLICADYNIIEQCKDKYRAFRLMRSLGIQTPGTYLWRSELTAALASGEAQFPVIVKPRTGMSSIAVYKAKNLEEVDFYTRLSERIASRYLPFQFRTPSNEPGAITQQMVHGAEYGLDVINDLKGNYCNTIVKQKIFIQHGASNPAVIRHHEGIKAIGKRIGEGLLHPADCNVDLILSGDDVWILDLNPRFGGCYPYSHLAGANIPRAIIRWLEGQEPEPEDLRARPDTWCYKEVVAKAGTR